jgi:hypothetical protein
MTTKPDLVAASPGLVRRLLRENQQMGQRLAQYEFGKMQKELGNKELFDLEIQFPGIAPARTPRIPPVTLDPVARRLPAINVPLGSIAWVQNPQTLPVLGIFVPDCPQATLRKALHGLLIAHATEPFARMVFICESLRPIPFLGRYKFAYEYIGATALAEVAERMALRYAITQIRDLLQPGSVLLRFKSKPG